MRVRRFIFFLLASLPIIPVPFNMPTSVLGQFCLSHLGSPTLGAARLESVWLGFGSVPNSFSARYNLYPDPWTTFSASWESQWLPQKDRLPIEILGKSRKNPHLGSGGSGGTFLL